MTSKVPNFPIQSAAAIRLATEAAKAKVDELGNRGFYKVEPGLLSSPCIASQFPCGMILFMMCCMFIDYAALFLLK